MPQFHPFPRTGWLVLSAATLSFIFGSDGALAQSGPQEPGSVYAAAKSAVAQGQVVKTTMQGFGLTKQAFNECPPEGAVLIGFDLGLGSFSKDKEEVYALRPLYRSAQGDVYYQEYGLFEDKQLPGKKTVKTHVKRVVQLKAKPGYAVGAIHLHTSLGINALSVTYMRIAGANLDAQDKYSSNWYGNRNGKEVTLGDTGAPLVGVFGNQDESRVLALGAFHLQPPTATAKTPVKPSSPPPPNDPPVAQQPGGKPAGDPPRANRPSELPGDNNRPQGANNRPVDPLVVDAAPQEDRVNRVDPLAKNSADPAVPEREDMTWVGVLVFLLITVPGGLILLFILMNRKKSDEEGEVVRKKYPPDLRAAIPPVLPAPQAILPPLPSTAITEKPPAPVSAPLLPTIRSGTPLENVMYEGLQPTYIQTRATCVAGGNRLYRVYFLPDRLLFLHAGAGQANQMAMTGAAVGGLIGALIGSMVDKKNLKKAKELQFELDCASKEELMQMAELDKNSFTATSAELDNVRIDPAGFWHKLNYSNWSCVGLLRFKHASRGRFTLELATREEVRLAIERLPFLLGDRVGINLAKY